MTRVEALSVVDELQNFFLRADAPGKSEEAVSFTRKKIFALDHGVAYLLNSEVVQWAEVFYSARKWQQYGEANARTNLLQSVARVRIRINMAPDAAFG